jgi:hypothetical protein
MRYVLKAPIGATHFTPHHLCRPYRGLAELGVSNRGFTAPARVVSALSGLFSQYNHHSMVVLNMLKALALRGRRMLHDGLGGPSYLRYKCAITIRERYSSRFPLLLRSRTLSRRGRYSHGLAVELFICTLGESEYWCHNRLARLASSEPSWT